MILDPDNQYIKAINDHAPLAGKTVLEIGCGDGRITRDLAAYAKRVVATDISPAVLERARHNVTSPNVEFLLTPDGFPDLPGASFDLVIYTLSLHHIPVDRMIENLRHSGHLLKRSGAIVVVEPGEGGSFLEIKQRFGAGSGDESEIKAAAIRAMKSLSGWNLSPTWTFDVAFLFTDAADFYANKLPHYRELTEEKQLELDNDLRRHTTRRGIILTSGRNLNLLTR